jgi:hypothetical protein
MREMMSGAEARWFQQKTSREAPTWMTSYDDYREVGGILLPHRWLRTASSWFNQRPPPPIPMQRVDLRFNIAVNGAEPDTVAPEL